jgi:formate hydrogenlyase subunit 6/NADH:ubiquinone oxidoreductase subunit I
LCSLDCPANAIELITLDKKAKRFVLRYHLDQCAFCGQCVESCRFGCLELSNKEWELAAPSGERFTLTHGRQENIEQLAASAGLDDETNPAVAPAP